MHDATEQLTKDDYKDLLRQMLFAQTPEFKTIASRWMVLYDAAVLLGELNLGHEATAAELRQIADDMMTNAGLPAELIPLLIASRPPLPGYVAAPQQ